MGVRELLLGEAEVVATVSALLGGLTFSASVIFYTTSERSLFNDILLTMTIITTLCFVFAALCCGSAATIARKGNQKEALKHLELADAPYAIGLFLMLGILVAMGFSFGWQLGIAIIVAISLLFIHIFKRL